MHTAYFSQIFWFNDYYTKADNYLLFALAIWNFLAFIYSCMTTIKFKLFHTISSIQNFCHLWWIYPKTSNLFNFSHAIKYWPHCYYRRSSKAWSPRRSLSSASRKTALKKRKNLSRPELKKRGESSKRRKRPRLSKRRLTKLKSLKRRKMVNLDLIKRLRPKQVE